MTPFLRCKVIERFNILTLCFLMNIVPFLSHANNRQSGFEGQKFAQELLESVELPRFVEPSQPGLGIDIMLFDEKLVIDESFFDPLNEIVEEDTDLSTFYDDETKLIQNSEQKLKQMTNSNSLSAEAFQQFQTIDNRARPDLSLDPMFRLSQLLLSTSNLSFSDEFDECTSESSVPLFKQCDRYAHGTQSCELRHDYEAGIIEHIEGPLNISSCAEGCIYVWIGEVGDNYWRGNCTIFEEFIRLRIINPKAIDKVILEYAKWDDYMQIWIDDYKIWSGPNDLFPPETQGACELSTNWEWTLNQDLTSLFTSVEANKEIAIKMRTSVTGLGEGYARIKIQYNPSKILVKDEWYPESCLQKVELFKSQFSEYGVSCIDLPDVTNKCSVINGLLVCEKDFSPPLIEGISPFCRLIRVTANEETYQDSEGTLCHTLESNPACGFYSSQCSEYNRTSGQCQKFQDIYECSNKTPPQACTISSLFPSDFADCEVIESYFKENEIKTINNYFTCEKISESVENGTTKTSDIFYKKSHDSCEIFEKNPQCHLSKSMCLDEKTESLESGSCRNLEMTFNCPEDILVSNVKRDRKYHCDGPIECLGHECMEPIVQIDANFNQALAQLNLAQDMGNDLTCDDDGISQNIECELFKGEASSCLKSIGNIVNCCDRPKCVSLGDYVELAFAMNNLNSQLNVFDVDNAFYGTWQSLKQPIEESWSHLLGPLSSRWDALIGASPSELGTTGAVEAASSVLQSLTNSTAKWVGETLGAQAQTALFSNVGGTLSAEGVMVGGNFYLGQIAGTLLSGVMTVYTIYSVTLLLLNMIWPCEAAEFELGVKRELKSCHSVGSFCKKSLFGKCLEKVESYCCFSSPLARIFQEQARTQLNLTFGEPRAPMCEGLSLEQLDEVNMENINLDEWIAILGISGRLEALDAIDIDSMTQGKYLTDELKRTNVLERLNERIK
ncbi:conjugal transfer protein TraN [Thorsellia kenyensis]|uniref:Conjugal transfer protein TraN n=1 Tax=Thorsellia kenyensis TaxID=1549888 RepID=A0ABV6CHH1_9GAMM